VSDPLTDLNRRFEAAFPPVQPHRQKDADALPSSVPEFTADLFKGKPVPPREWMVENYIPLNAVTLLGGDGGTGKTLLGIQLCVACVAGTPWLGLPTRHSRAVFVSAEDDTDELHRRLAAIGKHADLPWDRLDGLKLLPLADQDAVLARAEARTTVNATELFAAVERKVRDWKAGLLVLDALHNVFAGDENDRAQAVQFIALLRGLTTRCRTTILVLAHPSLSGMSSGSGTSGSTGWSNAVRSRLYLSALADPEQHKADPDVRTLRVMKANYGPRDLQVEIRWQDGVFVCDNGPARLLAYGDAARRADYEFLRMMEVYAREGRRVSSASSAPNNAPNEFAGDHRCAFRGKSGKVAMKASMNRLFAASKIDNVEDGPPSRKRSYLVLVPSNSPFQPPSDPVATLPTPLSTLSPNTPDVRAPASKSGRARSEGEGQDAEFLR
jgi:RecA-family ATPase